MILFPVHAKRMLLYRDREGVDSGVDVLVWTHTECPAEMVKMMREGLGRLNVLHGCSLK